MSILLDYQQKQLNNGVFEKYNFRDTIVRYALQLFKIEESKIQTLRQELEIGEASPVIADFNPQKHLNKLHEKYL